MFPGKTRAAGLIMPASVKVPAGFQYLSAIQSRICLDDTVFFG